MKNIKELDADQLIEILITKSKNERGFIANLSRKLEIPYDRLQSWQYRRGKPKGEDMAKLKNEFELIQELSTKPESEYHPDHAKYVALLEKNNKTFEDSIQLSLNTIKISLSSILEGQSDLKTISQQGANNTFVLLDEVARIRGLLQNAPPPSKGESGGIELSNYGVSGTGKKVGSRGKG